MKALLDSSTPGTKATMLKVLVRAGRARLRLDVQSTNPPGLGLG
jgi:hypothetical protein